MNFFAFSLDFFPRLALNYISILVLALSIGSSCAQQKKAFEELKDYLASPPYSAPLSSTKSSHAT